MHLVNIQELVHTLLVSSKTGESFSESAILHQSDKLFVHHEVLAPGKAASSPHRHSASLELIFVLEGHPTAHQGHKTAELKPGDCLTFHPDQNVLHFIENRTASPVRFLVIVEVDRSDKIVFPL